MRRGEMRREEVRTDEMRREEMRREEMREGRFSLLFFTSCLLTLEARMIPQHAASLCSAKRGQQ